MTAARAALTLMVLTYLTGSLTAGLPPVIAGGPDQAAQPGTAAGPSTGRIGGQVMSATDGSPLADARVTLITPATGEQAEAITGANGRFAFVELPAGEYRIVASTVGYASRDFSAPRSLLLGPPLPLEGGQQRDDVDFRLAPAGGLSGRVIDERGEPVASIEVEAIRPLLQGGQVLGMFASDYTDDEGVFHLTGLPEGDYFVRVATTVDDALEDSGGVPARFPTYYPGTQRAADADLVHVDPGRPAPIVLLAQQPRPLTVSGRLVPDLESELLAGTVTMIPYVSGEIGLGATFGSQTRLNPDGSYTFNAVPPGDYIVLVQGRQTQTLRLQFATFRVSLDSENLTNVQMPLRDGAQISGRVVIESDADLPPVDVSRLRVRAPRTDEALLGGAPRTPVNIDGTYLIPSMAAGTRIVRLEGLPAPWVLKSVQVRGNNVIDTPIELEGGQHLRSVRLIVGPSAAGVRGTVRNRRGDIRTDRSVVAIPVNPAYWTTWGRHVRVAYLNLTGQYRLEGLPAGRYRLVVTEEIDRGELFLEDRIRQFAQLGVPVMVEEDAVTTLDLTADDRAAVRP